MTSHRRRIVADVDTGIDDMLALIYLAGLHRAGEIELAAVTATAGNTTVCQAPAIPAGSWTCAAAPTCPSPRGSGHR
nr:nucleoside hydrolase [Corynebacterium xerosis]